MNGHERTVSDLVEKLKGIQKDHYEYLEVKQLTEILARHRAKARDAVAEYRQLKRAIAAETDAIEKLYLNYEGMFLRDHLRDALRLYVMVCHDFHEAYRSYMDALKADQTGPVMPDVKTIKISNSVIKMPHRRRKAA